MKKLLSKKYKSVCETCLGCNCGAVHAKTLQHSYRCLRYGIFPFLFGRNTYSGVCWGTFLYVSPGIFKCSYLNTSLFFMSFFLCF